MLSYINKSYRRQLLMSFILLSVIPLLVSGILLLMLFRIHVQQDFAEKDMQQERLISGKLEDSFRTFRKVILEIEKDADIEKALRRGHVQSSNVYAALYRETGTIRDISVVDIYAGDKCIYTTDRGHTIKTLPKNFGILARADQNPDEIQVETFYEGLFMRDMTLQIAKKINANEGYVVITVKKENLMKILNGMYSGNDGVFLLNRFYEPLFESGNLGNQENLQAIRTNLFHRQHLQENMNVNVYCHPIETTGLILFYLTPPALNENIYSSMLRVLLLLAVLAILVSAFLAGYVSNYLSRPIRKLNGAMRDFRHGNLQAHIATERDDEFGELSEGFNKTTVQIRHMMEERVRQQKELNATEIAMVQAQLNPHFLYNTLDTIKWVAKAHHVPEIAMLVENLSKLLRRSISGSSFVTLQDALDVLESYCAIEEFRFEDTFSCEIEVPEELMNCVLPKLILQPVVENAIIHGLDGVTDGLVKITACRKGDDVEIRVMDNGHGITDDMLKLLASHDQKKLKGHLGFTNVDTILRLYYGEEYGLKARRLPEAGTEVLLRFPYALEAPKEVSAEIHKNS